MCKCCLDLVLSYRLDSSAFENGLILGNSQNFARELMELPSNMLTPTIFANRAKDELEPLGVKVTVYDENWIKELFYYTCIL